MLRISSQPRTIPLMAQDNHRMEQITRAPRVWIDGVPLLFRSAGVKNYLHHWILHLQRAGLRVRVFPCLTVPGELDHERSVCGSYATFGRLAAWHGLNLVPNHLLDWAARDAGIFHSSKLLNPPRRLCLTATLYDATCWLMPECHTRSNVAAEKAFAERIWKRAAGLIAISESTRNDAVRLLGLDPRRIRVIYPGIPQPYFDAAAETAGRVRSLYGLDREYVLCVGTLEPRKNLATLLDAYELLPAEVRQQYMLVVAGPAGWSSANLKSRLQSLGPDVRYLGYVPEAHMPALFAGATLFAYISLYEGFGFPVAQALAAGVPVLTSAASSLPELAADAAELVEPRSVEAVRAALLRLLTSETRRSTLARAGRLRAREFTWERCARQSLEFFQQVDGRAGV